MKKIVEYMAADGTVFDDEGKCREHEQEVARKFQKLRARIPDITREELRIGGGDVEVDTLPFVAPWMSAFGSCLIKITDIRRRPDGVVEFQLADEAGKPYDDGNAWATADKFWENYPK